MFLQGSCRRWMATCACIRFSHRCNGPSTNPFLLLLEYYRRITHRNWTQRGSHNLLENDSYAIIISNFIDALLRLRKDNRMKGLVFKTIVFFVCKFIDIVIWWFLHNGIWRFMRLHLSFASLLTVGTKRAKDEQSDLSIAVKYLTNAVLCYLWCYEGLQTDISPDLHHKQLFKNMFISFVSLVSQH